MRCLPDRELRMVANSVYMKISDCPSRVSVAQRLEHQYVDSGTLDSISGSGSQNFCLYINLFYYYIILHYITLHCIALHYITLHYIILYDIIFLSNYIIYRVIYHVIYYIILYYIKSYSFNYYIIIQLYNII